MILSTLVFFSIATQGQITEDAARRLAIEARNRIIQSSPQSALLYDQGATVRSAWETASRWSVTFSDGSHLILMGDTGEVSFASCEGDEFEAYRGLGISVSAAFETLKAAYAALGYSDPLSIDNAQMSHKDPMVGAIRLDCAPIRNGIPVAREYNVVAFIGATSGGLRQLDIEPLPNINTAMKPVLTVEQARPILLGYLFANIDATSVVETDYEVNLRWGRAPLREEVNVYTNVPIGDLATLRATNTALLMYDVRFMDPNYTSGKTGEAYYRVIMDARNGQVVGMVGPVIAMFGGGDARRPHPVQWGWGSGPITLTKGKVTATVRGDVEPVKTKLSPRGVQVILTRGNLNVRASYDAKANLLWLRRWSAVDAGKPSKEVRAALRRLTSEGTSSK